MLGQNLNEGRTQKRLQDVNENAAEPPAPELLLTQCCRTSNTAQRTELKCKSKITGNINLTVQSQKLHLPFSPLS